MQRLRWIHLWWWRRWKRWLLLLVLAAALGAHATAVGLSYGTIGALALAILLITWRTHYPLGRWAWEFTGLTSVLAALIGLMIVFALELVIGCIAVRYGSLYATGRPPLPVEIWISLFLSFIYGLPGEWIHWVVATLLGGAAITVRAIVLLRNRAKPADAGKGRKAAVQGTDHEPGPLEKRLEYWSRRVELVAVLLLVLESFSFGNVLDNVVEIDVFGPNAYAGLYGHKIQKLGDNEATIERLNAELGNLDALGGAEHVDPDGAAARTLAAALSRLTQAMAALAQAQAAANANGAGGFDAGQAVQGVKLPDAAAAEQPPSPAEYRGIPEFLRYVQERAKFQITSVQAETEAEELLKKRNGKLHDLGIWLFGSTGSGAAGVGLSSARIQAMCENAILLVAEKGAAEATRELMAQADDLARQAAEHNQANLQRGQDMTRYRSELADYLGQRKACFDLGSAVAAFLVQDPRGATVVGWLGKVSRDARERMRGPHAPLLGEPELPSGQPDLNQALTRQYEDEIAKRLLSGELTLDRIKAGYNATLASAFAKLGGNVETPGYGLLADMIDDACAGGQSPETLLAEIADLPNRPPN